jgi:2-polyprenyl-6-methoxyphenol hydroxylase-like FAD-dependent oxidoreductase
MAGLSGFRESLRFYVAVTANLQALPALPTIWRMALPFDVCIRGAGIVGQTLALLLARERLRIALVATDSPPPEMADVRAYALNAASRQILESVRCWPNEAHATPVLRMQVHGDDGGQVQFDAGAHNTHALAWITDVPTLQATLADAVRFQPQIEVVSAPVPAALTVVCEGRASQTRAELGVEFETTPYPQHAIATRLECEHRHQQIARQWFANGNILAFLPLGGPDGNSAAVVWSVKADDAPALLSMPPEEFTQRLQDASHSTLGALHLCAPRHHWPLQKAQAQRWCGPMPQSPGNHWALAGDAAHTVHPLAGQGLNLGLGDAQALARVLHGRAYWRSVGDLGLLRRYERERKAALWPMLMATDGLQQLFARPENTLQNLRNWGLKGFERSGPFKQWVTRQAMGLS